MAERNAAPAKPKAVRKPRATKAAAAAKAVVVAAPASSAGAAKAKFSKALEDARAGAQALGKQAQDTAGATYEKIAVKGDALLGDARAMTEQARDKAGALLEDAKAVTEQAKEKAGALAAEGKARAVDGISAASRIVADTAPVIDEKLGAKFGDYARTAAKTMDEAAAKLEAKDLTELGDDARALVRKRPGLAIGIAAAAGFMLSRLFKGSPKASDEGASD